MALVCYSLTWPVVSALGLVCCCGCVGCANADVVVLDPEPMGVEEHVEEAVHQMDYSNNSPMMVPHTMQYTQVRLSSNVCKNCCKMESNFPSLL